MIGRHAPGSLGGRRYSDRVQSSISIAPSFLVLLLANAMLCWLLRNTTNRPAAPTMSSNLILTLLEHSIVFAMTNYFEPNYPRCWMWLAIIFAPAALLSCLVSRPTPKGSQQDPFIEVLASLFHVFTLAGLWLFEFPPLSKLVFALHDPLTTFHEIMVVVLNTCVLQCCYVLQHKHRTMGRTWPSVMTALVYLVMVAGLLSCLLTSRLIVQSMSVGEEFYV